MGKHSKEEDIVIKRKSARGTKRGTTKKSTNKVKDDDQTITVTVRDNEVKGTKKSTKTTKNNSKKDEVRPHKRVANRIAKRITVLILIVLLGLATAGVVLKVKENGGGLVGVLTTALGEERVDLDKLEPIQIMVIGISGVDEYKLADTIMVASYDPKTQSAGLLSIPRDTYVGKQDRHTASTSYLQSYKINAVYRNGANLEGMMERINALTGLNVDKYVVIDTAALQKLVDAIGGVTFDVPIDMWYTDDTQNLKIDLRAGTQLIDGAKAEQLVRFRHNDDDSTYPTSYGQQDLGRMRTQREFVTATLKQTLKPQNIFKIRKILDIMQNHVKTNLDVATLKQYLPYAVEFDADNLKTAALDGSVEMCNGVSIMVVSPSRAKATVEEVFGANSEE